MAEQDQSTRVEGKHRLPYTSCNGCIHSLMYRTSTTSGQPDVMIYCGAMHAIVHELGATEYVTMCTRREAEPTEEASEAA